jgi:hypothetical protein
MGSSRYLKPETSAHHQSLSDGNFFSEAGHVMAGLLDKKKEIYVPAMLTESQYTLLRKHLEIGKNPFVFSHSMFIDVYAEPNGVALVNNFFKLLMDLPSELRILQATTTNFFAYRLRNIFSTEISDQLFALTDKKIGEALASNQQFCEFSARQQRLFIALLLEIKKNNLENTVTENLVEQLPGMTFLTHGNVEATLGISLTHVEEIVAELDRQLSEEFFIIMQCYLHRFMTQDPNTQTIKFILQEYDVKSPLAFFNKQLHFPFLESNFDDYVNHYFISTSGTGKPVKTMDEAFFRLYVLLRFYEEYPETQLSKTTSVKVTQQLLARITDSKKRSMKEKLIQFETVFVLAEIFVNKHANPRLDRRFGIANTHTWQVVMAEIRNVAFAQLTNVKNYPSPLQTHHYLPMLRAALKSPLFNKHRHNYYNIFSHHETETACKIQTIVNTLQRSLDVFFPSPQ